MLSIVFAANLIIIDLKNFTYYAIEDNVVVRSGQVSGGRKWCPDIERSCKSPSGWFKVLVKKGRWYRSPIYPLNKCRDAVGKKDCAPMPFSIKFKYSGESLHGAPTDDWNNIKHRSHGCLHLKMNDIEWLNKVFTNKETDILILPY